MAITPEPLGFILLDRRILDMEPWMIDQLLRAASLQLTKYKPLSIYIQPSEARKGDFTAILDLYTPDPKVVQLIAIPGRTRAPIVQTVFTKLA